MSATRCLRNPCPRARTAERIAGPAARRPECTETYISLQARLTSGTSESRAKFTTTKARASNSVTKAAFCEVRTNSFRNSTSPNLSKWLRETRMMITSAAGSSASRGTAQEAPNSARRSCVTSPWVLMLSMAMMMGVLVLGRDRYTIAAVQSYGSRGGGGVR